KPTPDRVLKFLSPFPIPVAGSDSFLEESDTSFSYLDNSLPKFEISSDYTEETRSGSTTTHANYSLPEGSEIDFSEDDDSFTFVIRTILLFLTYPEVSLLSCSTGSEDTIFDPGIST
ncbi:hypothetical protein Tco_1093617, partial [Tanacetum coccineum]